MKPIEIWLVIPNLHPGGAERVVVQLCNGLNLQKFKPVLVVFKKEGLLLNQVNPRVQIIELGIERIRYLPFKLLPLVHRHRPTIVMAAWGEIGAYLAPFIGWFGHTHWMMRETNTVSQHVKNPMIRFLYRFITNYKTIIAQSDDMQADLINHVGVHPDAIIKINNPVAASMLWQQSQNASNPYPITDGHRLLAVGNLSARKGFDRLLNAMVYLKDKPVDLFILGQGIDDQKLKQQALDLGLNRVHFLGIKANVVDYYAHANALVLSSRYEGFPNVLLEAGACGLFSVCNDASGGINEIIQPINGVVHSINDALGFAQQLWLAVQGAHSKKDIHQNIANRYDASIIIPQFETAFEKLMG